MTASVPWVDLAPDPDIVPHPSMAAAEQDAAAAALQTEIRAIVATAPALAADVERVGLRAAGHLARSKTTGEVFVLVEFPRFASDFDPSKLSAGDRMAFSNSPVVVKATSTGASSQRDSVQCIGAKRPLRVKEALALLLSAANPERELALRRTEAEQRRKAAVEAAEREASARAERARAEREFEIANRERIAVWARSSRLVRALARVADRLPGYRQLVNEIVPLLDEKGPPLDKMSMPREWFLSK